jgi:hypothetical protein
MWTLDTNSLGIKSVKRIGPTGENTCATECSSFTNRSSGSVGTVSVAVVGVSVDSLSSMSLSVSFLVFVGTAILYTENTVVMLMHMSSIYLYNGEKKETLSHSNK